MSNIDDEILSLEITLTSDNVKRCEHDVVEVQVLYDITVSNKYIKEYWLRIEIPVNYPNQPAKVIVNEGNVPFIDSKDLEKTLQNVSDEHSTLGSESLFSIIMCAKEFIESSINDMVNSYNAPPLLQLPSSPSLPVPPPPPPPSIPRPPPPRQPKRKEVKKEKITIPLIVPRVDVTKSAKYLKQTYQDLSLENTNVHLTIVTDPSLIEAVAVNIQSGIREYLKIHPRTRNYSLCQIYEIGFDILDQSYGARCFRRRSQTVARGSSKLLLWHGAPGMTLRSIMADGALRTIPRVAHGRMFGDGVYFADCMCKSLSYCDYTESGYYLLLCIVNIDNAHLTFHDFEMIPEEIIDSGVPLAIMGRYGLSSSKGAIKLDKGLKIPIQPFGRSQDNSIVNFNEYIISNDEDHAIKYLVKVC